MHLLSQCFSYDDDYILIDCPGQIELYSHVPDCLLVCALHTRRARTHMRAHTQASTRALTQVSTRTHTHTHTHTHTPCLVRSVAATMSRRRSCKPSLAECRNEREPPGGLDTRHE